MTRKKKIALGTAAVLIFAALIAAIFIKENYSVIFQRGNPIPYLTAAMKISEETPYVKVDVDAQNTDIFISRKGECPELFSYIEDRWNVKFQEQMGSGYLFSNDSGVITASTEIYWKFFYVWTVPQALTFIEH